ncbi:PREDICTED: glutaminyl-peptide cyclotransferase-like [Nicrophorus vespilloides]|uniref:glutaminyl-peptide cyclotransferase n=1 Tax=Nicrophorus vespilloides TaxID=110193 RepID=A0ABM1M217_NICVS|nr:PREDICTED: glutaminyl-peptide cyclotransferase-like [Nicrophorus vespilloides]
MVFASKMLLHFVFSLCFLHSIHSLEFAQLKNAHRLHKLGNSQIEYVSKLSDVGHMEDVLDNILIERVVGTPNHDKVHDYIVNELKKLEYDVEVDTFHERTPTMGHLKFRNIIGTLNPRAERFLTLACHYDSKYFKNDVFLGATDSAVPCAMMLNLAKVLKNDLQKVMGNEVTLQLLFLDGEEAFLRWGPTDSLYGARHLADAWHRSVSSTKSGLDVNKLQRMDAFVLLDLIGTPDPTFFSYFPKTERLFVALADAEDKLMNMGQLKKYSKNAQQKYFKRRSSPSFVEDDHVPFMIRGVPILHLIPKEFPKEWHTPADNRDAVDMTTVENLNKILRVFVCEYLHVPLDIETDGIEKSSNQHIPRNEL